VSQEILFLIFMTGELIAILLLYQFIIIPKVSLATNNLFEERMLDKTWDIPAMLEDYTEHLAIVFSEIIKKCCNSGFPRFLGSKCSNGCQHGITTHQGSSRQVHNSR